jgi:flavin reductase (DIM6/NTAB) family NADH-FMN oxidoreductase RutF
MFYDTASNAHGLPLDPFYALVVPRPIAWISTLSKSGKANLAPYSFYNAFSHSPHYVAFGSSGKKDSLTNIEATGEFVVNLATFALRDAMNVSSLQTAEDEFVEAGLEKATCRLVKAPRIAASPVSLECTHFKTIDLPNAQGVVGDYLVIGRVVGVHIADEFIKEGRVDTAAMQPIARLGYAEYATVDEVWRMRRPQL